MPCKEILEKKKVQNSKNKFKEILSKYSNDLLILTEMI